MHVEYISKLALKLLEVKIMICFPSTHKKYDFQDFILICVKDQRLTNLTVYQCTNLLNC